MIFDYVCNNCNNEEKNFFVLSIKEEVFCDKCEQLMERQFPIGGRLTINFIGDGFYCTTHGQKKWNGRRYCEDYRQITTEDARQINAQHDCSQSNEVDSCSIKPIGDKELVKPQATKML